MLFCYNRKSFGEILGMGEWAPLFPTLSSPTPSPYSLAINKDGRGV